MLYIFLCQQSNEANSKGENNERRRKLAIDTEGLSTAENGRHSTILEFVRRGCRVGVARNGKRAFCRKVARTRRRRTIFNKVLDVQDTVEFVPGEYIAQGDKVVVLGHFLMRIKSTGREFSSDWVHVWTVKNGKVTRFYEYVDTAVVSKAYTAARAATKRS